MLRKTLLGLLLAVLTSIPALAVTQQEFCQNLGGAAFVGAAAKVQGMSQEAFNKALAEDLKGLDESPEFTPQEKQALRAAVQKGFASGDPTVADRLYEACMLTKV